jgi:outer membrane protein OmpA-like peptidoglycan-associated protein
MVEGKTYCIEMAITMAEASKYATNNIGFMFVENVDGYKVDLPTFESWDEDTQRGSYVFQNNPNLVYNYKNKVYDSYGGWDKVCNTYKPPAGSKINGLIIGNFSSFDPKFTKIINQTPKKKIEEGATEVALEPMAYYYIDNIRIKEVANRGECNCFKQDTSASSIEFSKVVISKEPIIDEDLSEAENLEAQVIYYGFGEKSLDETGKRCIEMLLKYLKDNPTHSVQIISHNDKLEDSLAKEYDELRDVLENLDLKRAEFIQGFVSERYNINKDRIIPVERNADEPNVSEYDANQVQINEEEIELRLAYDRRVTFKIIKK